MVSVPGSIDNDWGWKLMHGAGIGERVLLLEETAGGE